MKTQIVFFLSFFFAFGVGAQPSPTDQFWLGNCAPEKPAEIGDTVDFRCGKIFYKYWLSNERELKIVEFNPDTKKRASYEELRLTISHIVVDTLRDKETRSIVLALDSTKFWKTIPNGESIRYDDQGEILEKRIFKNGELIREEK